MSLCSQLAYTHSANRNASFPFSLVFTSVNGRTHQRLESLGGASYKRWANTTWMSESYEHLWKDSTSAHSTKVTVEGEVHTAPASALEQMISCPTDPSPTIAQNTFVYLTADTEDELTELKPNETYIIGGICDHNRYKVRVTVSHFKIGHHPYQLVPSVIEPLSQ